jgi:ubiquitin-protein ligase
MNVRLRRLENDSKELADFLRDHPFIGLLKTEGDPPEKYHVEYRVKSVEKKGAEVTVKDRHTAEIVLTLDYPSQEPICRMLTPVFHPNIDPHLICITDRWAAGESLTDVVVRIGRMLAYQTYNIKSPRNGEAAQWAAENLQRFPLDPADLAREQLRVDPGAVPPKQPKDADASVAPPKTAPAVAVVEPRGGRGPKPVPTPAAGAVPCANCRTSTPDSDIRECRNGHRICPDCAVSCRACGATLCVLCDLARCSVCQSVVCPACQVFCHFHRQPVCSDHIVACAECGVRGCDRCLSLCPGCGKHFCRLHFDKGKNLCAACRKSDLPRTPSCPYCGRQVTRPGAKFCSACGQKF